MVFFVEVLGNLLFSTDGISIYLKREQIFVSDPELGYVLKPDFQIEGKDNRLYPGVGIKINSLGYRSAEIDSRPRILLVGDSVAFGFGVQPEGTIASQLEDKLDGKYQVINAGVPGYNIEQWRIMANRAASILEPDLVIALVNANDFGSRYYPIMGGATVSRYKSFPWEDLPEDPQTSVKNVSQYFSILKWFLKFGIRGIGVSRLNAPETTKDGQVLLNVASEFDGSGELKHIAYYNSQNDLKARELYSQAIDSMNQFSLEMQQNSVKVLFSFFPYRISAQSPDIGIDQRFDGLVKNIKAGPDVAVVVLNEYLDKSDYFLIGDSHPSASGNTVIAARMAEKVIQMGLVEE